MKHHLFSRAIGIAAALMLVGCASPYRTSSNVEPAAPAAASAAPTQVLLSEGKLLNRKYREIGPVEVSVKKATVFHKDPTREQANEALIDRARVLGADAVIGIVYKSGIGMTTWGYMDAQGIAVKFLP